jgi:hypothetical protein
LAGWLRAESGELIEQQTEREQRAEIKEQRAESTKQRAQRSESRPFDAGALDLEGPTYTLLLLRHLHYGVHV